MKKLTPHLLTLALLPATIAFANPVTTTPAPSRERELVRHQAQLQRAQEGDIQVAFISDSITAGWEHHGKEIWNEDYLPLKAANFGINGDGTQHVLWRIQGGILQGYDARLIVLAIGTNNHTRPAAEIVAGVEEILAKIREQQPRARILITSVMPRGNSIRKGEPEAFARKFTALNAEYAKLADHQRVFFLDTFAHMQGPENKVNRIETAGMNTEKPRFPNFGNGAFGFSEVRKTLSADGGRAASCPGRYRPASGCRVRGWRQIPT